jgi:hypothetical protein
MQIFIQVLNGDIFTLNVDQREPVVDLMKTIQDKTGIPVDQQRVIFACDRLEEDKTLDFYNIQNESTIQVVLSLKGC